MQMDLLFLCLMLIPRFLIQVDLEVLWAMHLEIMNPAYPMLIWELALMNTVALGIHQREEMEGFSELVRTGCQMLLSSEVLEMDPQAILSWWEEEQWGLEMTG